MSFSQKRQDATNAAVGGRAGGGGLRPNLATHSKASAFVSDSPAQFQDPFALDPPTPPLSRPLGVSTCHSSALAPPPLLSSASTAGGVIGGRRSPHRAAIPPQDLGAIPRPPSRIYGNAPLLRRASPAGGEISEGETTFRVSVAVEHQGDSPSPGEEEREVKPFHRWRLRDEKSGGRLFLGQRGGLIKKEEGLPVEGERGEDGEIWVKMEKPPFNMRMVNLNNFPQTQTAYRSNYRSHSMACTRAKMGSIQSTAKSLDLMRKIIQRSINEEIDVIVQKYAKVYFEPAVTNIRLNNGDSSVTEEHLLNVYRQILEEAKSMYSDTARSVTPDLPDTNSDCWGGVIENRTVLRIREERKRRLSSGSESSSNTARLKRKGRPQQVSSNRSTPSRTIKSDNVKKEGRLWDTDRLKAETLFVMGAKANKALGLGATRGRLYIKHPDVFKYSGDQDDKQWLHEHHLMPATGGRTYLLLVEDILQLAGTDEYRSSPGLLLGELKGFSVPEWMLEKMKAQMRAQRTEGGSGGAGGAAARGAHRLELPGDSASLSQASPASLDNQDQDYDDDLPDPPQGLSPRGPSPLHSSGGFHVVAPFDERQGGALSPFGGVSSPPDDDGGSEGGPRGSNERFEDEGAP